MRKNIKDFPFWWLHIHLSRMNKRKNYYVFNHKVHSYKPSKISWNHWYNKSKSKIIRRHQRYIIDCAFDFDWKMAITDQVRKIYKQYDPIHLWGLCEYKICDKINNRNFRQVSNQNQLWKYKTIQIAKEINKRKKLKGKLMRGHRYTWDNLISNNRYKFQKTISIRRSEEYRLWDLCYRANYYKVQDYWEAFTWHPHLYHNILKIERLMEINL